MFEGEILNFSYSLRFRVSADGVRPPHCACLGENACFHLMSYSKVVGLKRGLHKMGRLQVMYKYGGQM